MTGYTDAGPLRRLVRRIAASGPGSWVVARVLHHAEVCPGYVRYEARAAPRRISVFRLIPPRGT